MSEYIEPSKNKIRNLLISSAIETLTTSRQSSTLASRDYVRKVRDYLSDPQTNQYELTQHFASLLSDETIEKWENFYDSIVQTKKSENLKVAYLSGPNPENDLRILVENGVLPENVWAFEMDNNTYSVAVSSALESEFPFIKIVNSNIDSFLETSPQRFDIIYLDFCGPLPSSDSKTLAVITKVLQKHAIAPLGVLITNIALPECTDNNAPTRKAISKIVATYLYPKPFLENFLNKDDFEYENWTESASCHGIDFIDWINLVEGDLEHFYGQYITRLIIDHASFISSCDRFPCEINSPLFHKFFNIPKSSRKELNDKIKRFIEISNVNELYDDRYTFAEHTDVVEDDFYPSDLDDRYTFAEHTDVVEDDFYPSDLDDCCTFTEHTDVVEDDFYPSDLSMEFEMYPTLWSLSVLNAVSENSNDEDFKKLSRTFLKELNEKNSSHSLIVKNISQLTYLLTEHEGQNSYLSNTIKKIKENHNFSNYYNFCDLVLFHQILELLFRQIACPYHVNIEKTKRWSYKSDGKHTQMFSDMFVLDECRYLYDWMPTMDMISNGFQNLERQFSYRFALDAISKHRHWYNQEYFFGTAVVSMCKRNDFEPKVLSRREFI
jgi:hypothetical protein